MSHVTCVYKLCLMFALYLVQLLLEDEGKNIQSLSRHLKIADREEATKMNEMYQLKQFVLSKA